LANTETFNPMMAEVIETDFKSDETQGLTSSVSPLRMAMGRYWRHRAAAVCTVIMGFLLIVVIFAPWTARYGINEQVIDISEGNNINLPPQSIAWFGTEQTGYDMYSLIIWGLRTSLYLGVASAILSVVVGATVGSIAGMYGGRFDDVIMRITDVFLAFPFLVAIIVLRNFLGSLEWLTPIIGDKASVRFLIFLFAIFGWMGVARLVRSQVLALKEREFVEAARAVGATDRRIIISHLLPNCIGPILVALTIAVVAAIVGESTLAFFGFGPQPGSDSTSLGKLIELSGPGARQGNWWLVLFPCGALVLVTVCISFIGDGLRDAFDPKLDHGRTS
jgi:peptide/nickel transport system permease protein